MKINDEGRSNAAYWHKRATEAEARLQKIMARCADLLDEDQFNELVARHVAAAPDLLALAHQYASECGECAGTRVCPDDAPCTECGFIWDVINKVEGKS